MKSFVLVFSILLVNLSTTTDYVDESVCLSAEEMKLYDAINEYRAKNKLAPIPLSARLTKVAQAHAQDLVKNFDFDPNGKCNPHSWSSKGNWTPCCYTADHKQAECMWKKPAEIAGYKASGYEIAHFNSAGATAQSSLDGWKSSPAHNPLLVNSGIWARVTWKAVGIGIYGEYGIVWFGDLADETVPVSCK